MIYTNFDHFVNEKLDEDVHREIRAYMVAGSKKDLKQAVKMLNKQKGGVKPVAGYSKLEVDNEFYLDSKNNIILRSTIRGKNTEGFPPKQSDFTNGMGINPGHPDFDVIGPLKRGKEIDFKKALQVDDDTREEAQEQREWDHTLHFKIKPDAQALSKDRQLEKRRKNKQ